MSVHINGIVRTIDTDRQEDPFCAKTAIEVDGMEMEIDV
jgi:hypothetical protein